MIKVKNFLAGIVTLAVVSCRTIWEAETYAQRLLIGILLYIVLIILADKISEFCRLDRRIKKRIERRKRNGKSKNS